MRKQVTEDAAGQKIGQKSAGEKAGWLDLETLAQVEVSSEAGGGAIENALVPGSTGPWRSGSLGPATITLRFDMPQVVRRVLLHVVETEQERAQEWALTASFVDGSRRELLRQGWNFSPAGSTEQREEYAFDLKQVTALTLMIDADRGRDRYPATLMAWRVGDVG